MPLSSICRLPSADGDRLGQRAAVADPQLLDRAQRGAGGAADVVGSCLQAVELLDDDQRDHDVDAVERGHAGRVGDEDGRVEHDPRPDRPLLAVVRRRCHSRREQIGQRHSLGFRDAAGEVANGVLLYRRRRRGWWMERPFTVSAVAPRASSAPSSPATPRPRSCTATTSPWPSSIARRCSRATCSSCRRRTSSRCPSSTTSGRSSSGSRRMAAGDAGRPRRAGHVRGQQQRRQPERRPPARARRAAHEG